MSFRTWFENEIDGDKTPASAEVIRTGLQPQVDSQEIETSQKEENDRMMAIDGHLQRVQDVLDGMGDKDNPKLNKIKQFCNELLTRWAEIKKSAGKGGEGDPGLGVFTPNQGQVKWMQDNQPLPENPKIGGPGIYGGF